MVQVAHGARDETINCWGQEVKGRRHMMPKLQKSYKVKASL